MKTRHQDKLEAVEDVVDAVKAPVSFKMIV